MDEFWKPCLVPSSLVEQEQASSECFLEWNRAALREIFVWCVPFWRKKYPHLDVAPSLLLFGTRSLRVFSWNCPNSSSKGSRAYTRVLYRKELRFSYIRVLFVEKSSDIAIFGFFLSCGLEVVCPEEVFWVTCAFLKKKVHSLSVAPEPLAIWNKKLEGLESYAIQKSWKSSPVVAPKRISGFFYSKRTRVLGLGIFSSGLLLSVVVVW